MVQNILSTIVGIGIFLLFWYILLMIGSITRYFNNKSNYIKTQEDELTKQQFPEKRMDYLDRLEATMNTLTLINAMVENEISRLITTLSRLNQKYDAKNMDKDVRVISEKVYSGFKKVSNGPSTTSLISNQLVLTDEFIMQHIMDETVTQLLIQMQQYNATVQLTK